MPTAVRKNKKLQPLINFGTSPNQVVPFIMTACAVLPILSMPGLYKEQSNIIRFGKFFIIGLFVTLVFLSIMAYIIAPLHTRVTFTTTSTNATVLWAFAIVISSLVLYTFLNTLPVSTTDIAIDGPNGKIPGKYFAVALCAAIGLIYSFTQFMSALGVLLFRTAIMYVHAHEQASSQAPTHKDNHDRLHA